MTSESAAVLVPEIEVGQPTSSWLAVLMGAMNSPPRR